MLVSTKIDFKPNYLNETGKDTIYIPYEKFTKTTFQFLTSIPQKE